MKGLYKFAVFMGAAASVASLVMLVTIANHIVRSLEEEQEVESDSGLVDVDNSHFPQQ